MRYLASILLVILAIGCATPEKNWEIYTDMIATDMAPLNVRLRGNWARKEKLKEFSVLSTEDYIRFAQTMSDPSEKEYLKFLTNENTRVEFMGQGRDFVVCVLNINLLMVFCDKASTGLIDFVSKDVSIDIQFKIQSLFSIKE